MVTHSYWHLHVSFNFDHMLSVGTISFEDRFYTWGKYGMGGGGGGGFRYRELCRQRLLWLALTPWSVLSEPFLQYSTQTCRTIIKHLSRIVSTQSHITNCQLQNSSATLPGMRLTCPQELNMIINLWLPYTLITFLDIATPLHKVTSIE